MSSAVDQQAATIHHELGHAVAAEAVGYQVLSIDVGDDFPEVRYRMPTSDAVSHRHLIVTLAGSAAEEIWAGRDLDIVERVLEAWDEVVECHPEDFETVREDYGDTFDALQIVSHLGEDLARDSLLADAREILTARWPEIASRAGELAA